VLAEKPFRFRALHTRLESHVGEHVDDNALTRSLHRLTRLDLIRADSKHFGNRVINTYSLSEPGRENLAAYEALVTVYLHLHELHGKCDGRCPVHEAQDDERAA
jgi:DNA-binding HxlR family transcriptional regulator